MLQSYADGRLFGRTSGSGTPRVLALHGWARTHADFDAVLEGLPAIALDLPGFGATPPPPEAWGSAEYARAVAPVLDAMADRVVVVGHSFGGKVALALAVAHPDRVASLVLAGVPLLPPPGRRARPAAGYRLVRRLRRLGLVGEARLEAARRRHGSTDYRRAEGVMRQVLVKVLGESYEGWLRELSCPVRLVWGDDDTAAPLEVAREAQAMLAGATLDVLPGAGHLTPLTAPGELRRAVEAAMPCTA